MATLNISQKEFDFIREYLKKQSGIDIDEKKKYLVESRLSKLVIENGQESFTEFCQFLKSAKDVALRDRIVNAMTTNETLWFRDGAPWIAFRDRILHEFVEQATAKPAKRFRVWSAACSTGQEPYTIAMLIDDFHRSPKGKALPPDKFDIVGTDISTSALFIATAGRYDRLAMNRGLVADWQQFRDRYFHDDGRGTEISPEIKKRVKFKRFNLQDSFTSMGRFDVVLLRNVTIYFSDDFKRDLLDRVANAMSPGAYLMLGSTETLIGLSDRFQREMHGQAKLYRLKG